MDETEIELQEREEALKVLKERIQIAKEDRDNFIRLLEELKE